MRSQSRLTVCRTAHGTTEAPELWAEAPQLLRITDRSTPDRPLTVHLVGGAAGPLGGDDSEFALDVQCGAQLCVRSVAATLAQPGAQTAAPGSTAQVRVHVARDALLDWRPEPIIAVQGCNHSLRTDIDLEQGAALVWSEEVVCGRFDEPAGRLSSRQRIAVDGTPVLDHEVCVGGERVGVGWHGRARHIGTTVWVGLTPPWASVAAPISTAGTPHMESGCRSARFALATGAFMEIVLRD